MMLRLSLPLLLALLASVPAPAQVRLLGSIVDGETEQPIAGARVEIFDFAWTKLAEQVTDQEGAFEYRLRRPGTYHLRASKLGYRTATARELRTGAHSYVNVEVRLVSDAVLLAPLTVVARTGSRPSPVLDNFHARLRSGIGTFYTREDIARIQPAFVSDVVTRVPGMLMMTSGSGLHRQIYTSRSFAAARDCPAQIWVDGFLLNPRGPDGDMTGLTLDEAVRPSDVDGIEIYRGLSTIPAEFLNQDARCGVIAVWTRRGGAR